MSRFCTSAVTTSLYCADSTKGLLENSTAVDKVDAEGFDAVFIPGGHGVCADMPDSVAVQKFVAGVYDKGSLVGSVCHGPAALVNVKIASGDPLVKGKKVRLQLTVSVSDVSGTIICGLSSLLLRTVPRKLP